MRARTLLLASILASSAPLCPGATSVPPFASAEATRALGEEERNIWSEARDADTAIAKSGQIYPDEELQAYAQRVLDGLYPEFRGTLTVRVLKSTQLNAFALPNGSIYISRGLLSRFDNETQLATVLAHEGIHFVNRHGYQSHQTAVNASGFATVVALLGVPLIGDVIAISSMLGYSRELESEADTLAFQRISAAGYDVSEAPKVFEHLMREVKASGNNEPFFFSSHPKLKDRVENFQRLAKDVPPGGEAKAAEYAAVVEPLRIPELEAELSAGRAKEVIGMFEDSTVIQRFPPYVHYYIGEAYRMRRQAGDEARADEAYGRALEAAPGFAPTYRALGVLCLKRGQNERAAELLAKYIELAPAAPDRGYAEQYLWIAKQRAGGL